MTWSTDVKDSYNEVKNSDMLVTKRVSDLIDIIGWGKFHWKQGILQLYASFVWGLTTLLPIFIVPEIPCNEGHGQLDGLPPYATEGLSAEWKLHCDNDWMRQLLSVFFFVGFWIGLAIGGGVSDARGRKQATILTICCLSTSLLLNVLATSFSSFLLFRTFVGASCGMVSVVFWVSLAESCSGKYTGTLAAACAATFSVSGIMLPVIVLYFPAWRQQLTVVAFSVMPLLVLAFTIAESPVWLAANGRLDDALQVLEHMAQVNGVKLLSATEGGALQIEQATKPQDTTTTNKVTFSTFFRNWTLFKVTLSHSMLWFVMSVLYYGLGLNVGALGGSLYLTAAVSSMMDLPGELLGAIFLSAWGRRFTHIFFFTYAGCCCLLFVLLPPSWPRLNMWVALFGKIGAAVPSFALYAWTGEVMPTVVRSTGTAICSQVSRIGGLTAPLMIASFSSNTLYTAWGMLGLAAGWICYTQYETVGKPLPETIEDLIKLSVGSGKPVVYTKVQAEEPVETEMSSCVSSMVKAL